MNEVYNQLSGLNNLRISKMMITGILVLCLFGCSTADIIYSDSYVYGQDSQFGFLKSITGSMAETSSSIYFVTGPEMGFLYICDKGSAIAIPACNKPNCLHADEPDNTKIAQCDAFLGIRPKFINYYQGAIYYVLDESASDGSFFFTLNKTSLDGTKHQRICTMKDVILEIQIHRGYVYYSTRISENDTDSQIIEYKLCRYPLNNVGAEPEIIEEGKQISGIISGILCYGNHVYYYSGYYSDAAMEKHVGSINRFNILTKDVSAFVSDPGVISRFTIFNDKLVYPVMDQGTLACALDGTNKVKICDEYGINAAGENMLYIDNLSKAIVNQIDRKLIIVDKNWQVVKTVSLKGMTESPLGCTDDCYFIPDSSTSNDFGPVNSLYCVSPEDMTLKPFFQFSRKVRDSGVVTQDK